MATRLYPATQDKTVIEMLAGVPAGTTERLAALNEQNKGMDGYEAWQRVQADNDCGTLDSFQTFGWGRLRLHPLPNGLDYVAGRTNDADIVRRICRAQGIESLADTLIQHGGVSWC